MKIKYHERNSWWNHIPKSAKIVKIAVFLKVSPPSTRLLHSKFHSKMSAPRSEFASNIGTMRSTGRFPSRAFGAPCSRRSTNVRNNDRGFNAMPLHIRLRSHCTIFCKRLSACGEIRHTYPLESLLLLLLRATKERDYFSDPANLL